MPAVHSVGTGVRVWPTACSRFWCVWRPAVFVVGLECIWPTACNSFFPAELAVGGLQCFHLVSSVWSLCWFWRVCWIPTEIYYVSLDPMLIKERGQEWSGLVVKCLS